MKRLSLSLLAVSLICLVSQQGLAANALKGAEIFKQCVVCHTMGAGAEPTIGPTLNHVFGRVAGGEAAFEGYSEAMQAKGAENHLWHEKTLYKFLANPAKRVPGTIMAFPGLKTEKEIKDLLAYMIQFSPAYIPKSRKAVTPEAMAAATVPEMEVDDGTPENPDFSDAYLASVDAIATGEDLWAKQCRHCHGNSAYPGKAPKLTPARYTPDFTFDRITNGFRKMPAWKTVFTLDERTGLVAYILSDQFSP